MLELPRIASGENASIFVVVEMGVIIKACFFITNSEDNREKSLLFSRATQAAIGKIYVFPIDKNPNLCYNGSIGYFYLKLLMIIWFLMRSNL